MHTTTCARARLRAPLEMVFCHLFFNGVFGMDFVFKSTFLKFYYFINYYIKLNILCYQIDNTHILNIFFNYFSITYKNLKQLFSKNVYLKTTFSKLIITLNKIASKLQKSPPNEPKNLVINKRPRKLYMDTTIREMQMTWQTTELSLHGRNNSKMESLIWPSAFDKKSFNIFSNFIKPFHSLPC